VTRRPRHKDLFDACAQASSSLERLRLFLEGGADPSRLYHATVEGHGRDRIDALTHHLLFGAGDPAVLALLIEAGGDPRRATPRFGLTPLHIAVQQGLQEAAVFLLGCGVEVDSLDKGYSTALHYAAQHDAVEIVRLLLDRGADPRRSQWRMSDAATPAAIAASRGAVASLELILAASDDPNLPGLGAPPIHCAVDAETMSCLARHRADLDVVHDGVTALMAAAAKNQVRRAGDLLDAGAGIDVMADGRASLHVAVAAQHGDMVRLLLERGADPQLVAADGRSALEQARSTNPLLAHLFGDPSGIPRRRPTQLAELLLGQKRELKIGEEAFGSRSHDALTHRHPAFTKPGSHTVSVGWAGERCAWLLLFGGTRAFTLEAALSDALSDLGCKPYDRGEAAALLRVNEVSLVRRVTEVTPTKRQIGTMVTQFLLDGGKFERGDREGYSGYEGVNGKIRHYEGYPGMTREEEREFWIAAPTFAATIGDEYRLVDGLVASDERHRWLLFRALQQAGYDSVRALLEADGP